MTLCLCAHVRLCVVSLYSVTVIQDDLTFAFASAEDHVCLQEDQTVLNCVTLRGEF